MIKEPTQDHNNGDNFSLIGIEELAVKMGVHPNTIRKWVADGDLKNGRHFVQVCSVRRFKWPDIIKVLAADGLEKNNETEPPQKTHPTTPACGKRINIDY
jgi:hypothetical protein